MSKKIVAIAMSGGVDSSVAAYLIKKQGYHVFGVFMHLWADPRFNKTENACCSLESYLAAKKAAQKIGIKLYTLNLSKEFKKNIVDDFIKQYKSGVTPNPCVRCNQLIKFDLLFKKIKKLGADYLATGHYVILKNNKLYKSQDKNKDQTYFLYQIKKNILKYLLFPVGKYNKSQIWQIAKKNKLIPENKKESQDVCFVPKGNLNLFLKKYIKQKKGDILEIETSKILGKHLGLFNYTIGQRAGLGGQGPYYVISKNIKKNILYVSNDIINKKLFAKKINIKQINWLSGQMPKFPLKCTVKCRSSQKEANAIIKSNIIEFTAPQKTITPGQSAVFYKNKQLLGGGIII